MNIYLERTLSEGASALVHFMKKGSNVLDIGVGPGTITLDVARAVTPIHMICSRGTLMIQSGTTPNTPSNTKL